MVQCNFDLGDFSHKSRSFLVRAQNESRRSPDNIATDKTQKLDEDIDYLVTYLSPQNHLAMIQPR